MGIDDLVNKGKDVFEQSKDKVAEVLNSGQAEGVSDKLLDGATDLAKKILPDEHDAKIDEVRANIDKSIGNE